MDKHRMCECCRTNFLLKDMKGDLCIVCYDFIQTRQNDKIADLEAKLEESEKLKDDAMYNLAWLNQDLSDTKEQLKVEKDAFKILSDNYNSLISAYDQLKQQLAEERKKVVMEIREKLCRCDEYDCCCIDNMNIDEVHKFLDQIERGE